MHKVCSCWCVLETEAPFAFCALMNRTCTFHNEATCFFIGSFITNVNIYLNVKVEEKVIGLFSQQLLGFSLSVT